ncbi:MAG: L-histidine N(alpha)-methyltransferase, partial [Thaumarchaeota archaeon]|nr:L-histidine N(alpha)-methyltransferase [Nitrososphaerota archaeon]
SQGVTGRFNLNLLTRINKELYGNFDLENFDHVAFYNSKHNRIEMHLSSKCEQEISISKINLSIKLRKNETILTEYSYKYTPEQIEQIASKVGFKIEKIWYDKNKFFSLVLFSV